MSGKPVSEHQGDQSAFLDGRAQPVRLVLVFAIVALALMTMSVDSTIVATVLHSMQHGLRASINWAGWSPTSVSWLGLPVHGCGSRKGPPR